MTAKKRLSIQYIKDIISLIHPRLAKATLMQGIIYVFLVNNIDFSLLDIIFEVIICDQIGTNKLCVPEKSKNGYYFIPTY